jgi:hypothetical protein
MIIDTATGEIARQRDPENLPWTFAANSTVVMEMYFSLIPEGEVDPVLFHPYKLIVWKGRTVYFEY